jgi:hypothetical protein
MNATADTARLEDPISILEGIETELAKLYRSLQAHQGRLSIKQVSRGPSVESAIDDLIAWMRGERGLSLNYQVSTRQGLGGFARWVRETRPEQAMSDIRTAELSAYLASEKKRGLSPASLRLITVAIKILFRRLKNHGIIKRDPAELTPGAWAARS